MYIQWARPGGHYDSLIRNSLDIPCVDDAPEQNKLLGGQLGAKTDSLRRDYKLVGDLVMNFFCKKIVCHVRDYGDTIVASQKIGETQK
jgi:hypothetical protein